MKKIVYTLAAIALVAPGVAAAQELSSLITEFGNVVRNLTPIVAGLALLVFFWGLVKFIAASGSEEGRKQGRQVMIWGIIALFVMASVWGLTFFIRDSLDLSRSKNVTPPSINF